MKNLKRLLTLALALVMLLGVLPMEAMAVIPDGYPANASSTGGTGSGGKRTAWVFGITAIYAINVDSFTDRDSNINAEVDKMLETFCNMPSQAFSMWESSRYCAWVFPKDMNGNHKIYVNDDWTQAVSLPYSSTGGAIYTPNIPNYNTPHMVTSTYTGSGITSEWEQEYARLFGKLLKAGSDGSMDWSIPAYTTAEALALLAKTMPSADGTIAGGSYGPCGYSDSSQRMLNTLKSFLEYDKSDPTHVAAKSSSFYEKDAFLRYNFLNFVVAAATGNSNVTMENIWTSIVNKANKCPYTVYCSWVTTAGVRIKDGYYWWSTAPWQLRFSGLEQLDCTNSFDRPDQALKAVYSNNVWNMSSDGLSMWTWGKWTSSLSRYATHSGFTTAFNLASCEPWSLISMIVNLTHWPSSGFTVEGVGNINNSSHAEPPTPWHTARIKINVAGYSREICTAAGAGWFCSAALFDPTPQVPVTIGDSSGSSAVGEEHQVYAQIDAKVKKTAQNLSEGSNEISFEIEPSIYLKPNTMRVGDTVYIGEENKNVAKAPTVVDIIHVIDRAYDIAGSDGGVAKKAEMQALYAEVQNIANMSGRSVPALDLRYADALAKNPPKITLRGFAWVKSGVKVGTGDAAYMQKYIRGYAGDGATKSTVVGDNDFVGAVPYTPGDSSRAGQIDAAIRNGEASTDRVGVAAELAAGWLPDLTKFGFRVEKVADSEFIFVLEGREAFAKCAEAMQTDTSIDMDSIQLTANCQLDSDADLTNWLYTSCTMYFENVPIIGHYTASATFEEYLTETITEGGETSTVRVPDSTTRKEKAIDVDYVVDMQTFNGVPINNNKADFSGVMVEPEELPKYHSTIDPNPHVEMNQGTVNSGAKGPTGTFNSMTGTPTFTATEREELKNSDYYGKNGHYYQYFAAGGTEFVVEFDGVFHHNETATRKFTFEWKGTTCALNKTGNAHTHTVHQTGSDKDGNPIYCNDCHAHGDVASLHHQCGTSNIAGTKVSFSIQYTGLDYVEITNLKVWQLCEAEVTGCYALLETDKVKAEVKNNAPKISYNIAGANTAEAGRMVYEFCPTGAEEKPGAFTASGDRDNLVWTKTTNNSCTGYAQANLNELKAVLNGAKDGAYMVSDYIVLHTTAGDEFVYYYEKPSTSSENIISDWGTWKDGKCTSIINSTSTSTPSGCTVKQTRTSVGFEATTSEQLWKANPHASYNWDPQGITYGGYNGNYMSRDTKYATQPRGNVNDKTYWATTVAGKNISKVFGTRGYNKGEFSQVANYKASSTLRILNDQIKIPDDKSNGKYDFMSSGVWYKNLVNYTKPGVNVETAYQVLTRGDFTGSGFYVPAGYGSSTYNSVCNGIVVYNPISCTEAGIVPIDSDRDQRVDKGTPAEPPQVYCPENASCPYMHISCATTQHLHNDSCYQTIAHTYHTGLNTHVHTDACKAATMQWYHNDSGCTYNGEYHTTTTTNRCSQCGHSCGYLVTSGGSYTAPPGTITSGSPTIATPYCWYQTNSSCGSYKKYAYTASATSTSGLCHAGDGWVRKPEYDVSQYSCNNLPLNSHSCTVQTSATIGGAAEQTYTGNGKVTLQPGTYNIALGGGKGGGSKGGAGGTVTGTITVTTTTTVSYGNDGGGAGADGAGGNAAWIAYGNYSRLRDVPKDKLIAVAGGGGGGNQAGGQGGGPNQAGTAGASQCGGQGLGGTLNQGGGAGNDARAGGYGYGGDGNCTYGYTGNEENGGGGGYYGGGGGGHDCTSYDDFDDGDGGGGSGYASTTFLSGTGGSTGANDGPSYVKFTGGTTSKDAGCYEYNTVVFACNDPHHAWDSNWHAYTKGKMHSDGTVCTGLNCGNRKDIALRSNKFIPVSQIEANGCIVQHTNGQCHLSIRGEPVCSTCGQKFVQVKFNATPTSRTNVPTSEWEHYPKGDSRCWEACHNANGEHDTVVKILDAEGNVYDKNADWVQLDWNFTLYYPNVGNFYDTGCTASGSCSSERGMGYKNGMDITEFVSSKWVIFPFDVVHKGKTYMASEPIMLNVPDTYFDFYVPLSNSEAAGAEIYVGMSAINDNIKKQADESNYKEAINLTVRSNISRLHDVGKHWRCDVVGRIGALTMNDVGDFRYSNFFKRTVNTGWLVPNVLRRVDTSKQWYVVTDQEDVRGVPLSQTEFPADGNIYKILQNHLTGKSVLSTTNTYGLYKDDRYTRVNNPTKGFPLSPSYLKVESEPYPSKQSALATQPMRVGYQAYMDFTTLGNYYGTSTPVNLTNGCVVYPHYYRLHIGTGALTAADVYLNRDGEYVKINSAGSTIAYNPTKQQMDEQVSLNWTEEALRRNYFGVQQTNTESIYNQTTVKSGSTVVQEGVGMPRGSSWPYGNYDVMNLTGRNRTSIGTSMTYGVSTDPDGRIAESRYQLQGARWHFGLGLPSSAVFVAPGTTPTTESIKSFYTDPNGRTDQYVIVVALEIYAKGDTWTLIYDGKNINSKPLEVIPGKTTPNPHPKYPGRDEEMPIVSIISINHSSKEDINQAGTH